MVHFQSIDVQTFLRDYWQKKPWVIRQALPDFINPLTADELAGLALEEGIESRMVFETPSIAPFWRLKTGPWVDADFEHLPETHWTLLVQGVDRVVPQVTALLDHFDFIPQWRVDDVMISYAVKHGSVGPHYDHYDVFLYQAEGRRKWSLTTQGCNTDNYLTDVDLRIMAQFEVEEEYILEPGDMLYLPPHVGHHGVSLSDDCMTYSFGFRSYQGQELWDSFGDYLSETTTNTGLYSDPNWADLTATSAIPTDAWLNARHLMQRMLNDEQHMKDWFGRFATRLDQQAEQDLPEPLTDEEAGNRQAFIAALSNSAGLLRDACCRMAYQDDGQHLFVNGCPWDITGVSAALVQQVANHRLLNQGVLLAFLGNDDNQIFLYELWRLQWLQWA
ncbi:MAG TPA: cupin [Legionella sp.]|nr:cupin [Legionella sp.]